MTTDDVCPASSGLVLMHDARLIDKSFNSALSTSRSGYFAGGLVELCCSTVVKYYRLSSSSSGWNYFCSSSSGVWLFCSNNLCQAIRWSMSILYETDTGT